MCSIKDKEAKQQAEELNRLLTWAGSPAYLARELDVSPQVVNGWIKRGRISATSAIDAERVTRGLFSRFMLRPDVKEWRV